MACVALQVCPRTPTAGIAFPPISCRVRLPELSRPKSNPCTTLQPESSSYYLLMEAIVVAILWLFTSNVQRIYETLPTLPVYPHDVLGTQQPFRRLQAVPYCHLPEYGG